MSSHIDSCCYCGYLVRRFLQKTKTETTVKKGTTRYSVLTQDIKRKVF